MFSPQIDIIDPEEEISGIKKLEDDEAEDFLGFNPIKDRSNIILCAQTRGGKTTFLQNLLQKSLLNHVPPENIYIFSKTAKFDLSYRPLILYLMKNTTGEIKIFDNIDMKKIKQIFDNQTKLAKKNMILPKEERTKIKRTLLIFDDIIGDDQLKSYQSDLCSFCTMSRHSNIINIFLTQDYTAIPARIR